jgi:hypothetical protein
MVAAEAASPQPTVPSAASIRTRRLCASATVTPDIAIGFCERQRQPDGVDPADAELCAPGGGTLRNCPYLLRAVMASRFSQQSK